MGDFSKCLVRLRREAGFPSAYRFYHSNGGRRTFPFTYVHYLRIEKGVSLPKPAWLARCLTALRLSPGEPGCRELSLSFIRDLLGSEQAFETLLAPLLGRAEDRRPPGAEALRWLKAHHAVHLSPEQFKTLAGDEATYWCSEVLLNDAGSWTAGELARAAGLEEADARAGLRRLAAAGLARRTTKGRFKARQAGKFYTFPGRLAGMAGALERVRGYWQRRLRREGREVLTRNELVRAESSAMRRYASALAETMDSANAYATHAKGEDTGLYLIESKVSRLMPL